MNPGKYQFEPWKDSGVTGRLEVTIWKASNPEKVASAHSKMRG